MASEATGVSGVAGRYATALFELADQRKLLDEVAADLATLNALIDESADLRRMIRSPVLSRGAQSAAMASLVEKAGITTLTQNFVAIVAKNRRLFALPEIITGYRTLLAKLRGEITAEVTAAQSLSAPQVDAINEQLKRAVGSKVAVQIRVDPAIIGGLIVKVGSRMVDGSLRTKLQRLQLAMRGV
ncbi:MAG TPA: F0F1 ATP synthase subunit delta [Stellaceae bacterium]|nr:F0F1 ATP synthase subunit delta [Stellaceae bacterium]